MPKFLIAVIVVLVIGCRKGNLLSPAEEAQGFFPLAEGNTWVYESHFSWEPDTTLVREVTLGHQQIDTVSGLEYYNPISTFSYARFASSRPVWCTVPANDSRGIYAVFTPGTSPFYTALLRFIDYPVMVGKSWIVVEGNTTFDGGSYRLHKIFRNIRTILGIESVTVPAGMFPFCYHIADSVTYREDYIT